MILFTPAFQKCEKNHKIHTSNPELKQLKTTVDFVTGDSDFTTVSSTFLLAFHGIKHFFQVSRKFLCRFFFSGDSIPNFQTLTVHEDPAQAILEESMCLKYKSCF